MNRLQRIFTLFALILAFSTTSFAQADPIEQPAVVNITSGEQVNLGPAPMRRESQTRPFHAERAATASAGVDVIPFDCPPIIKILIFQGNVGDGIIRSEGLVTLNKFTSLSLNSDFVRIAEFRTITFTTTAGMTILGRPEAVSWIEAKVEKGGWIVIRYWIQGVTIQTLYECHFSAGAVEGQVALYHNTEGGLCTYETWSVPEGLALSSKGTRINKGTFAGAPSLMFDHFCFWKFPTWDNNNILTFNQTQMVGNTFTWYPLQVEQPGKLLFRIFQLEVTLPDCQ